MTQDAPEIIELRAGAARLAVAPAVGGLHHALRPRIGRAA